METAANITYIIASAIYVLFIPGFLISLLFFDFKKIDLIERVALSFALSISVIPLLTFYLNLLGVKITLESVILEVLWVSVASGFLYVGTHTLKRKKYK
jgi:uncharacterized membrane protein